METVLTFNFDGNATADETLATTASALTASEINEDPAHQNSAGPFTLGRTSQNGSIGLNSGRSYDGSIAEIIAYNKDYDDGSNSISRIESYLALKYGITLDQTIAQDYIASDGTTTMWEAATNVGYDNDIFGIGRDDNQALDQRISKSVNTATITTISLDNDFVLANNDVARTTNHANDLQFLTIANNGGATSLQTTELDLTTYTQRIKIGRASCRERGSAPV